MINELQTEIDPEFDMLVANLAAAFQATQTQPNLTESVTSTHSAPVTSTHSAPATSASRKPNISYFHQFGYTCYIMNTKEYQHKY